MFFVVEGVDKAGKSTLVTKLIKRIPDCILLKIGFRPKTDSMLERRKIYEAYTMLQKTFLKKKKFNFLLDRFIISEMVYSIKRGYDDLEAPHLLELLKNMVNDSVFIYCRLPFDKLVEIHQKEKDDYVNEEDLAKLQERYDDVFRKIPHIEYNYLEMSDEEIFGKLMLK